MGRGATREESAVEVAAAEWRHKAVTIFSSASAVAYLPPVALMVAGQSPPNGWPARVIVVGGYLCFAFCALRHRTDLRTRTWVLLAGGYVTALIHLITIAQSPFGLALPAMLPILAIVFLGARAGWAATGVSMGVLLIGPLLQRVPGLVEMLTLEPAREPTPLYVILDQGLSLIGLLVGQMILLDRFHDFLMQSLTHLAEESGKLARAMVERKELERELIRVADEERRRLGQEIHDGVCQQLTGVLLGMGALSRQLGRKGAIATEDLSGLSSLVEESIDEARGVARGLCPLNKDAAALATALRVLARRTADASGIPVRFEARGNVGIEDSTIANHLYRIAQEALNNAVRHAHPSQVTLVLHGDDHQQRLDIEDDGDGLPSEISKEGMGLRTMAHRASLLEGEFAVTRMHPKGTRVSCRVSRDA